MFLDFYQHIPSFFDPIAFSIGSFSVRWYGLMYLVGFLVIYGLLRLRIIKGEFSTLISNFQFPISKKNPNSKFPISNKKEISNLVLDFLLIVFFAGLVCGRLGYVLLYNLSFYFADPLAIVSPYVDGRWVGLFGMSYHGALVGGILAGYIFTRTRKLNFFAWADFIAPAIPLGYFFGRIGNFLNGELYGRVTNSSVGMYFQSDSARLRHPSQLYEALLEGLFLFLVLWKFRNKKMKKGLLFSFYLIGYGLVRILVEFFRQPDAQIGLLLGFFSMGQALSFAMILLGLFLAFLIRSKK